MSSLIDGSGTRGDQNPGAPAIVRTGIVLPEKHPYDPNLYLVHFGSKNMDETTRMSGGIWCFNGISKFVRYRDINNTPISYGSYSPIQPYSPVLVLMSSNVNIIPTIIGFSPTQTSVPDNENIDGIYVAARSPNGSSIEIDDKTGAIRLIHNYGKTIAAISDDFINLEIIGNKKQHTGLFLRKGGFRLQLPNSTLTFDESGFAVSFDDGGSAFRITKKGVVSEGMEVFQINSREQVSIRGSKVVIEGTKDASISANELKIGGKQLTNITGTQINMESILGISLKSIAINLWAWYKLAEFASIKDENILMLNTKTIEGISTEKSGMHAIKTGAYFLSSKAVSIDKNIFTNMGFAERGADKLYEAGKKSVQTAHELLTAAGTAMLVKTSPVVGANNILANTLAGASESAAKFLGKAAHARDKSDKKSYGTTLAAKFIATNQIMEKFTTTPPTISRSQYASSLGKAYTGTQFIQNSVLNDENYNLPIQSSQPRSNTISIASMQKRLKKFSPTPDK